VNTIVCVQFPENLVEDFKALNLCSEKESNKF